MENLQLIITREVCPKCNGPGKIFGMLFEAVWSRCTKCGCEFMAGHTKPIQEKKHAVKL
jgi:ribosomal protein L37AE/L43A